MKDWGIGKSGLREWDERRGQAEVDRKGEGEKNEAGDVERGKIREALDGLPKSFSFILYVMGGFW